MKLKSLLLGSAAVMVAVSGARAADAIIVEPEPVEYVRVCDAYGAGWWYIPGTEYCLKFDGEVRVQYDVISWHDDFDEETSDHDWDYRARLNVRANNETEYGTLSSRIRFEANGGGDNHNDLTSRNEGPGDANTIVDHAEISLAGFRLGYTDSYWSTAGSYGYYQSRFDGFYGFSTALFVDYTYAANGWTFTIGAADGNNSGEAGAPDAYAGITYSGGGWYFAGIVYHDTSADAQAYKVRMDYDFGNGFAIGGWWASDDGETDYVKGHYWGVTSKMNLTDNLVLFGGYGEYDDQYAAGSNNCAQVTSGGCFYTPFVVNGTRRFGVYTDASARQYDVGLAWRPVSGLLIQPEWQGVQNEVVPSYGQFSLRIVRSF